MMRPPEYRRTVGDRLWQATAVPMNDGSGRFGWGGRILQPGELDSGRLEAREKSTDMVAIDLPRIRELVLAGVDGDDGNGHH